MRHPVFRRQFLTAVAGVAFPPIAGVFFFAIFARAEWRVAVVRRTRVFSTQSRWHGTSPGRRNDGYNDEDGCWKSGR